MADDQRPVAREKELGADGRWPGVDGQSKTASDVPAPLLPPLPQLVETQNAQRETDPSDPSAVWAAVLQLIAGKNPLTWVKSLTLSSLDQRQVHLALLPGNRELIRFINPQRREQLAGLFQQVLGQPVKVTIDTAPAEAAAAFTPDSAPTTRPGPNVDRQAAMNLPLVKQVMELFDATITAAYPAAATPPAEPVLPPVIPGPDNADEPILDHEESET